MKNKAIVLGNNYYIALSAIRCLGKEGVTVVAIDYSEKDTYAAESKYCSERLIAPHYQNNTREFVDFLIDYAKKQTHPPVLIPCHDLQVEAIDSHLDELKEYLLIPQTEQGLSTSVIDKGELYKLAEKHGMPYPDTVTSDDENIFEKVANTVKYPCIVKPVDSPSFVAKFRKKLFEINNEEELKEALKKAEDENLEVVVQRIIPGFDDHMYAFDAYLNQDSKVTHWATFQKYRQFPINFGASVYTGHKYVPELHEIGAKFLEALNYKGFAEIEIKKDCNTGEYYLIEINARITNFNNLIYKLGLNMPYITYRELVGQPLEPMAITEDKNMVFWYAYEDLLAIRDYVKTGQLTRTEIFKSFFKPKAYAIWDITDPMPSVAHFKIVLDKIVKKVFKTKD